MNVIEIRPIVLEKSHLRPLRDQSLGSVNGVKAETEHRLENLPLPRGGGPITIRD